jgi:hypothetical protein
MPLMSYVTCDKVPIYNNEDFTVESIDDNLCVVSNSRITLQFATKDIGYWFLISFCKTIHKAQSATYTEPYAIWGWDTYPSDIDREMRYVAVSRTSKKSNVYFGTFE